MRHLPVPTEARPWGAFLNVASGDGFLVKLIEVAPGGRLSLQRHFKREEFWIVVEGRGIFELNGEARQVAAGEMIKVGLRDVHRVACLGDAPLLILELQKGECREDDIERLADDYQRGNPKSETRNSNFGF